MMPWRRPPSLGESSIMGIGGGRSGWASAGSPRPNGSGISRGSAPTRRDVLRVRDGRGALPREERSPRKSARQALVDALSGGATLAFNSVPSSAGAPWGPGGAAERPDRALRPAARALRPALPARDRGSPRAPRRAFARRFPARSDGPRRRALRGLREGGFVHGVLNTDRKNITGERLDHGPHRLLAIHDPGFTAGASRRDGTPCLRRPRAFLWNLGKLAGVRSARREHWNSA
ncbi:protein adenylyltransferase SelO family protein [Sorangium sp. So ce1036]|uniref:protein adenylyltransferase SelO family protein n=1 Tax=Sorangium sp. So ce1036 TaxID=3133328 RepID=UPI003F51F0E7